MLVSKTPGAIGLRGGQTGGAAPDAETLKQFSSVDYFRASARSWSDTPVPDEAILPDPDFLAGWAVTDQRPRNMCVAFAGANTIEALRFWQSGEPVEPVSTQFLYWMMRREYALPDGSQPPGYEVGATRLSQARDVIERVGIVSDDLAPFHRGLLRRELAPNGEAPSDAARAAARSDEFGPGLYDFLPSSARPKQSLTQLFHGLLKERRPVAAGFPMFRTLSGRSNWHTVDALSRGEVLGPLDKGSNIRKDAIAESGHVICLIGYAPDAEVEGEGWFIFRNSWGVDFGHAGNRRFPELPPGYGTISAAHVDHYCWEYYAPTLAKPTVA